MVTMNPDLVEIARKNCNEDIEKTKTYINSLIEWIRKTTHLKARTNERLLLAFLRRSRFILKDAKSYIDGYYSFKNHFPEVMRERNINDSLLELNQTGIHVIPQKPICPIGPRLIISRFAKCDTNIFHPRQIFKLLFILLEILANEDNNATICGVFYIIDIRDITVDQMLQYDPFLIKKIFMLAEHGLPIRFKEVHVINMRRDTESAFNFIMSFLPVKRTFKFIVHHKAEDLYEHVPRDAMTIEYGGHNGFACEALKIWAQKLKDFKDYFGEDDNYGSNDKLRIGLTSRWNVNKEFSEGTSGSFRKIEMD